jgi:hypothetical protein
MALKTLMLRRSIDLKKKELEELRKKDGDFQTREAELENAIAEAQTRRQSDLSSTFQNQLQDGASKRLFV